jgi:hypothetical protein
LVDTSDSKSDALGREGSSPSLGIDKEHQRRSKVNKPPAVKRLIGQNLNDEKEKFEGAITDELVGTMIQIAESQVGVKESFGGNGGSSNGDGHILIFERKGNELGKFMTDFPADFTLAEKMEVIVSLSKDEIKSYKETVVTNGAFNVTTITIEVA